MTKDGKCTEGRGLVGAAAVAVSPDGRSVYVVSRDSNAIVIFSRNPTTGILYPYHDVDYPKWGLLASRVRTVRAVECVWGSGSIGRRCRGEPYEQRTVYVASVNSNAIAVFARDPNNGLITQLVRELVETNGMDVSAIAIVKGAR